jgi:hypothetical protein
MVKAFDRLCSTGCYQNAPPIVDAELQSLVVIGRWAYQAKKEDEEQIVVVLFVNENL